MKQSLVRPAALLVLAISFAAPAWATLIDNGDGTVSDSATGLMWDKCVAGMGGMDCSTGTLLSVDWPGALKWSVTQNTANYKNHNDWRVPNMKELYSIVDYTLSTGAHQVPIDTNFFQNWPGPNLWTSTTSLASGLDAFVVTCGLCNAQLYVYNSPLNVLLVRSGQADATFDLTDVIFRNGFD